MNSLALLQALDALRRAMAAGIARDRWPVRFEPLLARAERGEDVTAELQVETLLLLRRLGHTTR